jgi:hypothetical protein
MSTSGGSRPESHISGPNFGAQVRIGNAYAGWRVAMLIGGLKIEIVGLDGSPLRRLVLDPTKDYQRIP